MKRSEKYSIAWITRQDLATEDNCNSRMNIDYTNAEIIIYNITFPYLSTLPVLPGVSKFFIKSPGLQVRAPNLPGKSAASFEFFFFINFVVFKMSKRKIKQEVYSVLFFELFTIGKRKTEQSN